uniref:Uncharacterized protein n=1 Tax=Sinocyclocheilus rhinocerous TaxID=307959 RepID=A0A673MPU7_9TELE
GTLSMKISSDISKCSANWSGTQCERPTPKTNRSENFSGRSIAIIVPLVLLVCIIAAVAVGLLICKRCQRGKQVQRQPMANGGLNVEIGNPSYNMYEVDHDNHVDVGSFLHPSFTLDPHKNSSTFFHKFVLLVIYKVFFFFFAISVRFSFCFNVSRKFLVLVIFSSLPQL